MRITKHFSSIEISCNCGCGQLLIDEDLLNMAEALREKLGLPMIVHCANRCVSHNRYVGGAKYSKHIHGKAMDFHVKGISNRKLRRICRKLWKSKDILCGGLGTYSWGIHIDSGHYRTWRG